MEKYKITCYDPKKDKTVLVGTLYGDKFVKQVTSNHFMKIEQGYGIQEIAIQILKERKCVSVIIISPTHTYETSFQDWLDAPIKDYGNGPQRFLRLTEHARAFSRTETQLELF